MKAPHLAIGLLIIAVCVSAGICVTMPPPEQRHYIEIEFKHIDGQAFYDWFALHQHELGPRGEAQETRWWEMGWKPGHKGSVLRVAADEQTLDFIQQVIAAVDTPQQAAWPRMRVQCVVVKPRAPYVLLGAEQGNDIQVELDSGRKISVPRVAVRPKGFTDIVPPPVVNRVVAVNTQVSQAAIQEALTEPPLLSGTDTVVLGTPTSGAFAITEDGRQYTLQFSIIPLAASGRNVTVLVQLPEPRFTSGPNGENTLQVVYHPVQYTAPAGRTVALGLTSTPESPTPTYVYLVTVWPVQNTR